jgi:septal ring factor EnvC (AmiA/AmiB activator)
MIAFAAVMLLLLSKGTPFSQEKSSKEYMEAIKREENILEKLRKEIDENEKKLKELSKRESDVLAEIYHIEKKIDLTDRLITELESDIDKRQKELEELDQRIQDVRGNLSESEKAFFRGLRELYKRRHAHPLELIFSSSTVTSAIRRIDFMKRITEEDKRQIDEYAGLTEELGEVRDERSTKLAEISARMDEVRKEKASLVASEKKKEKLHSSVKKQKSEREKALDQLRQETRQLESLIGNLERKRVMAVERERLGMYNLDKAIGIMRWPVEGNVITRFGKRYNPDLGTEVISNGIDIEATKGATVHAVAPGRIEFSDWWQSYGKMVIVSHSQGYYSLYAHLSRVLINVGSDVKEGDVIGEVGDTGSLKGPYLHFEIRKGRQAVDPLVYLRKR